MTETTPDQPLPASRARQRVGLAVIAAIIVAALFAAGVIKIPGRSSGLADHSGRVAQEAGAASCTDTGFYVQSKLDGSKQIIYDCTFPGSSPGEECVTENGGIASNATVEVRALFVNALGDNKPSCLQP